MLTFDTSSGNYTAHRGVGVAMSASAEPDVKLPIAVVRCGYARRMLDLNYQREVSDVTAIEIVLAGDAEYEQGGEHHLVKAGEMFILRQNESHRYVTGPSGFVHKRYINLEGPALAATLRSVGLTEKDHVVLQNPRRIESFFREISRQMKAQAPGFRVEMSCLASRILTEAGQSTTPQYPDAIAKALEYMAENAKGRVTLKDLLSLTKMSQANFCRLFQTYMGVAPIQFFLSSKINEAKRLLENTDDSISAVAAQVGLGRPLYFSRQFKKHTGVSPSKWRLDVRRAAPKQTSPE